MVRVIGLFGGIRNLLKFSRQLPGNCYKSNYPTCIVLQSQCNFTQPDASTYSKRLINLLPQNVRPYVHLLRFDRPIGSFLLFWPSAWSISLAATAGHFPNMELLGLFAAGSILMRGAACVINDSWDKDFDRKVQRTKLRPLASNELSQLHALYALAGCLSVSLWILLQLNTSSQILGLASMVPVICYPLAKRFTHWPQLFLGLTINWGALLGWLAATNSFNLGVQLPLYLGCCLWSIHYDTIYAHQDKEDDATVGVKSTALLFGDRTKLVLVGFSSGFVGCLLMAGYAAEQGWPFYVGVAASGVHLTRQLVNLDINNSQRCLQLFKSNSTIGWILLASIVASNLLRAPL